MEGFIISCRIKCKVINLNINLKVFLYDLYQGHKLAFCFRYEIIHPHFLSSDLIGLPVSYGTQASRYYSDDSKRLRCLFICNLICNFIISTFHLLKCGTFALRDKDVVYRNSNLHSTVPPRRLA